jgi:hypothetical protein
LLIFAIQEKPLHDDNEAGGSLSFYAIQENELSFATQENDKPPN